MDLKGKALGGIGTVRDCKLAKTSSITICSIRARGALLFMPLPPLRCEGSDTGC